jgi:hypothetical protein
MKRQNGKLFILLINLDIRKTLNYLKNEKMIFGNSEQNLIKITIEYFHFGIKQIRRKP